MGQLKYLFIHETMTPPEMKVTGDDIRHWHTDPKPLGRGWKQVGYSDLFKRNGSIEQLNDYNEDNWVDAGEITNGASGFNGNSRHICLVGGVDSEDKVYMGDFYDFYTDGQFVSLQDYIKRFLGLHPDCKVGGHYQVNDHKVCPGFNVPEYLRFINIPEKYIYV